MLFTSLQSSLQYNNTDHFRLFINSFLLHSLNGTYTTESFSNSFIAFLRQIHYPSFSTLSSFLTSWLEQPGFPLITVFPTYTRSHTIHPFHLYRNSAFYIPVLIFFLLLPSLWQWVSLWLIQVNRLFQWVSIILLRLSFSRPNVTSFVIHLSPYLPAVIRQLSTDSLHQMDSEEIVRELRSQFLLLRKVKVPFRMFGVLLLFYF